MNTFVKVTTLKLMQRNTLLFARCCIRHTSCAWTRETLSWMRAQAKKVVFQFQISLVVVLAGGCATVPLDQPKSYSEAITDTADTHFGKLANGWVDLHEQKSGFFPLVQGMDALGARLDMANKAEKSLDLQYFLMKDDKAGLVIMNSLLGAADRGVRVRFLLDDIFTTATDRNLSLINQHPNIEVRLFNPISRRGLHFVNLAGDFKQANRRMHNKTFTVDNAISVVGGRNLADEYFQLKEESVFSDFDILAFGPIVREISTSFDAYWNHALAVPAEQVLNRQHIEPLESERRRISEESDDVYASVYRQALESDLLQDLITGMQDLFVADARVMSDDPDKLVNEVGEEHMQLVTELDALLRRAEQELMFIAPYYVPGDDGVQYARDLVSRDLRVLMVTNSLRSNNHIAAHSGYARYRRDVIDAGVELYEVRANAGREVQGGEGPEALTMHTKLTLIDRRYLLVGSLNLDPRAIELNSEFGLLIESEALTGAIASAIDDTITTFAYHVVKDDKGRLEWRGNVGGVEVVETSEPLASGWRRFKAWFMKIVPESQL